LSRWWARKWRWTARGGSSANPARRASNWTAGKPIHDLDPQNRLGAIITRLRRGDADIVPAPETRLEAGGHSRALTRTVNFPAVMHYFGDSIRGAVETGLSSVAMGMVLGVLLGMMPVPLPGGGGVRRGLAGGALITFGVALGALIVGYKGLNIPFDSLIGWMRGVQTQPACLACASSMASPSEAPNLA
jgi:uncharacterized transporter YbjL